MRRTTARGQHAGALSPGAGNSSTHADIENLSTQMLASLGISRTGTSKTPASNTASPGTVTRPARSSREPSNTYQGTPKTRVASLRASDGLPRTPSHNNTSNEPLTAIRRPAQLQASTSRTSSTTAQPGKSPRPSRSSVTSTTTPGRKSSAPLSATATPAAPVISQEEFDALTLLLTTKDEEAARLRTELDEAQAKNDELEKRCAGLEKDKLELLSPSAHGKGTLKRGDADKQRELDSLKKDFEMQENLLLGFQRENEKATAEIDVLKKRERGLTDHLKKIYGPSFSAEFDLTSDLPPSFMRHHISSMQPSSGVDSPIQSQHARRRSGMLGGLVSPPITESSSQSEESLVSHDDTSKTQSTVMGKSEAQALMEQVLSVQSLLQRFERRLLARETELIKKEDEAKQQLEAAQALLASA